MENPMLGASQDIASERNRKNSFKQHGQFPFSCTIGRHFAFWEESSPGHHGLRGPGQPICHGGHLQALSGMTLRAALSALSPCGMSSKLTLHEIESMHFLQALNDWKRSHTHTLLCTLGARHRNGAVSPEVRHEARQLVGGRALPRW